MTRVKVDGVDKEVLEYMIDVYINELFWLLTSIKSKCERLFEATKVLEGGHGIKIDLESSSLVKSIIDDSAEVANLIQPRRKRKDETAESYLFRKHRGEYLSHIFKDITITEMLNRNVRDSIEHFDERLDRLIHTVSEKAGKKPQTLAYNMVISDRQVMSTVMNTRTFPLPIRIYISSERKVYNMMWQLDIGKIYTECTSMFEVLKENSNLKKENDPGGMLVMIPQMRDE
jgi:hypothetical protein